MWRAGVLAVFLDHKDVFHLKMEQQRLARGQASRWFWESAMPALDCQSPGFYVRERWISILCKPLLLWASASSQIRSQLIAWKTADGEVAREFEQRKDGDMETRAEFQKGGVLQCERWWGLRTKIEQPVGGFKQALSQVNCKANCGKTRCSTCKYPRPANIATSWDVGGAYVLWREKNIVDSLQAV